MSAELEATRRRLQQMMLPRDDDTRQIANLDISGFMEPAAEVGGDYYDVISKDGRVVFGIGDVTGHGLESGVIAISGGAGHPRENAAGQWTVQVQNVLRCSQSGDLRQRSPHEL